MQLNKVLKGLILLVIGVGLVLFFKWFANYTSPLSKLIIFICYFMFMFSFYYNNNFLSFIAYIVALLTVLFSRDKVDVNISNDEYIFDWLKIVFKNKTVFINVFGNLVLYMPMVVFLNKKINQLSLIILTILLIIFVLEVIQYITSRGVFDIVDIILNFLGVIFVSVIILIIRGVEYGRDEKDKRRKEERKSI